VGNPIASNVKARQLPRPIAKNALPWMELSLKNNHCFQGITTMVEMAFLGEPSTILSE